MNFQAPSELKTGIRVRSTTESGFTLIETMIAVAILGIVMVGISSMLTVMHQQMTYVNARVGKVSLVSDLHSIITNNSLCTAALQGQVLSSTIGTGSNPSVQSISLPLSPSVTIAAGKDTALPNYGVIVKNLFFSDVTAAGTAKNLPLFLATIKIDLTETKNGALNAQSAPKGLQRSTVGKVYLQVADLSSRSIVSCYLNSSSDDLTIQNLCDSLKGVYDATTGTCTPPSNGKACQLGDNAMLPGALHQVIPGPNWGPWLPDGVIGAAFGLGTNPHYASNVGVTQATDLSPADQAIVNQIKAGTVPSGLSIGSGTNTVCVDGKWVDSGVVATTASSTKDSPGGGGDATSSSSSSSSGGDD